MTGTPLYPTARLRLLGLNPHPVMVVACLAAVLERSGVPQVRPGSVRKVR